MRFRKIFRVSSLLRGPSFFADRLCLPKVPFQRFFTNVALLHCAQNLPGTKNSDVNAIG
jgi:hypothetical protein